MSKVILLWSDPDDSDNGTNSGHTVLDSIDQMLTHVNSMIKNRPNLKFEAYDRCKRLHVEPREVVTEYRCTGGEA